MARNHPDCDEEPAENLLAVFKTAHLPVAHEYNAKTIEPPYENVKLKEAGLALTVGTRRATMIARPGNGDWKSRLCRSSEREAFQVAGSESIQRALVVDDDPAIRRLLQGLLRLEHIESDEASDVSSALSLIQKSVYSLLLTDLRMPGPSGIDLIRELRAQGNAIPVLIVSSDLGTLKTEELHALGRIAWIDKPFDTAALRVAVRNLLS